MNAVDFKDHRGNGYTLILQAAPAIKKGDIIKLRCVDVSFRAEGRSISLTENSSCLIIPDNFLDSQLFKSGGKVSPISKSTPRRSGKSTPLNTKRQANSAYPFLAEYDFEDDLLETKGGKKKGSKNLTLTKKSYNNRVPTTVADLLAILKKPKAFEHQRFVVNGYVLGFSENTVSKIVKKMDVETKQVYPLDAKVPKNREQHMKYIYHFIMFLKDSSVESSDQNLNVYVLTNEVEQNLFDLWDIVPTSHDVEGWSKFGKADHAKFEKKFQGLQNLQNKVKVVVELLVTKQGRPFFKLYDTIFLP